MTRRLDEALELAERSVALYEALGSGHGLAVSLATLGQVYVQLGDLDQAEQTLNRALRSAARSSSTRPRARCSTRWRRST